MTRAERAQLERQAGVDARRQLDLERELSRPEALINVVSEIGKALNNVADAIRYLGDAVSEDEPLNFSLARGLNEISQAIRAHTRIS